MLTYEDLQQAAEEGLTVSMVSSGKYKMSFNGKELQDELGLNYYDYHARNYDASLGRWMNIDPLAEKYTARSPYEYCASNPINLIDPTGMSYFPPLGYTGEKWKDSDGDFVRNIRGGYLNLDDATEYDNGTFGMNQTNVTQSTFKPLQWSVPEIDYSKRSNFGGYNTALEMGEIKSYNSTHDLILDWYHETGPKNSIIMSGGAFEQIKGLDYVNKAVNSLLTKLKNDNYTHIGSIQYDWVDNGSIISHTKESLQLLKGALGATIGYDPLESDLAYNPISALGSCGISVRVNPDYATATVAVYNNLSLSSGLDHIFGNNIDKYHRTTNQIYIWVVELKK